PQQPASCIQPERTLVVAYRGVDRRTWKAISAVQTTHAPLLPAVESTIRRQPDAAIRINRQTVRVDRTFGTLEPNDNIGFAVSDVSELAEGPRNPDASLLIRRKHPCPADNRVSRHVFHDAPVPDPKHVLARRRHG